MNKLREKQRIKMELENIILGKALPEIVFDVDYLYDLAEENKEKFQTAKPFQHIMFDNFLEEKTYNLLRDEHKIGKEVPVKVRLDALGNS